MIHLKRFLTVVVFLISTSVWAQSSDEIKALAEQGDKLAQAKVGAMYLLGRNGMELNEKEAAQWITKAAEQGMIEAQVLLAAMYDRGMGVTGNKDAATRWYQKAADQGHPMSMAILGKNPTAKGSVQFSYESMRLNAARSVPREYANKILFMK
jgi:TPR repeat protein